MTDAGDIETLALAAPRRRFPLLRVLLAVEIVLASVWWACAFYGAWTLLARLFGGGE